MEWKITSVEPNVEQFLSGGGSKGGCIRSLWPQHLALYRKWGCLILIKVKMT